MERTDFRKDATAVLKLNRIKEKEAEIAIVNASEAAPHLTGALEEVPGFLGVNEEGNAAFDKKTLIAAATGKLAQQTEEVPATTIETPAKAALQYVTEDKRVTLTEKQATKIISKGNTNGFFYVEEPELLSILRLSAISKKSFLENPAKYGVEKTMTNKNTTIYGFSAGYILACAGQLNPDLETQPLNHGIPKGPARPRYK